MGKVAEIAERPRIVCLCGSTRFYEMFQAVNLHLTLAGLIVLSIGCDTKSDEGLELTQGDKDRLDVLHLRKIDLADEIFVVNVTGYVGKSTAREIIYAWNQGKTIRWFTRPLHGVWHNPFPEDGGPCCQYSGCSQVALWQCDGAREFYLCDEHAFLFGYPMPEDLFMSGKP